MQILLVGCGNMGGAIVSGMLRSCNFDKSEISAILPNIDADIKRTEEKYGIKVYTGYPDNKEFDAILFAVKPQILPEILPIYRAALTNLNTIVISIAAGKTTNYLASFFSTHAIVRTMPNINALAGKAVTVGYANKRLTAFQQDMVEKIFTSVGKFNWVKDEALIDVATAISGSGPAYFFQFIEYIIAAGIELGLPEELARDLAIETFTGSAELLEMTNNTPKKLRESVTSPNGTTAAALATLNRNNIFQSLTIDTIKAAHKRATELAE